MIQELPVNERGGEEQEEEEPLIIQTVESSDDDDDDETNNPYHGYDLTSDLYLLSFETPWSPFKRRSAADYKILTCIGRGALGKVYKAEHIETGEVVALKCVKKARVVQTPILLKMVHREVELHALPAIVACRNIVTLRGSFQDRSSLYYAFDYAQGGNLTRLRCILERYRPPYHLLLPLYRLWCAELISVLLVLHQEGIVHRDIKPDNVLLSHGHIQVSDFNNAIWVHDRRVSQQAVIHSGMGSSYPGREEGGVPIASIDGAVSSFLPATEARRGRRMRRSSADSASERGMIENELASFGGTVPYWAPERVYAALVLPTSTGPPVLAPSSQQHRHLLALIDHDAREAGFAEAGAAPGCELDIWGMGCVFYEMLTGRHAFLRKDPTTTAERILKFAYNEATLEFPEDVGPLARDLCLQMLDPNPQSRAGRLSDFANHPFFDGFDIRNLPATIPGFNMTNIYETLQIFAKEHPPAQTVTESVFDEFTPDLIGKRFRQGLAEIPANGEIIIEPIDWNLPEASGFVEANAIRVTGGGAERESTGGFSTSGFSDAESEDADESRAKTKGKDKRRSHKHSSSSTAAPIPSTRSKRTKKPARETARGARRQPPSDRAEAAPGADGATTAAVTGAKAQQELGSVAPSQKTRKSQQQRPESGAAQAADQLATAERPDSRRVSFASGDEAGGSPLEGLITSERLREIMIERVIGILSSLLRPDGDGSNDMPEEDLVDAAGVLTWGPLRCTLHCTVTTLALCSPPPPEPAAAEKPNRGDEGRAGEKRERVARHRGEHAGGEKRDHRHYAGDRQYPDERRRHYEGEKRPDAAEKRRSGRSARELEERPYHHRRRDYSETELSSGEPYNEAGRNGRRQAPEASRQRRERGGESRAARQRQPPARHLDSPGATRGRGENETGLLSRFTCCFIQPSEILLARVKSWMTPVPSALPPHPDEVSDDGSIGRAYRTTVQHRSLQSQSLSASNQSRNTRGAPSQHRRHGDHGRDEIESNRRRAGRHHAERNGRSRRQASEERGGGGRDYDYDGYSAEVGSRMTRDRPPRRGERQYHHESPEEESTRSYRSRGSYHGHRRDRDRERHRERERERGRDREPDRSHHRSRPHRHDERRSHRDVCDEGLSEQGSYYPAGPRERRNGRTRETTTGDTVVRDHDGRRRRRRRGSFEKQSPPGSSEREQQEGEMMYGGSFRGRPTTERVVESAAAAPRRAGGGECDASESTKNRSTTMNLRAAVAPALPPSVWVPQGVEQRIYRFLAFGVYTKKFGLLLVQITDDDRSEITDAVRPAADATSTLINKPPPGLWDPNRGYITVQLTDGDAAAATAGNCASAGAIGATPPVSGPEAPANEIVPAHGQTLIQDTWLELLFNQEDRKASTTTATTATATAVEAQTTTTIAAKDVTTIPAAVSSTKTAAAPAAIDAAAETTTTRQLIRGDRLLLDPGDRTLLLRWVAAIKNSSAA